MRDYAIIIQWSAEDSAYIAICPDLPGVSAFGETRVKAVTEYEIALRLALETYQAEGWEMPPPSFAPPQVWAAGREREGE